MTRSPYDEAWLFYATANSPVPWRFGAYELVAAANLCFRRYARLNPAVPKPPFTRVSYYEDVSPRSFLMLYAFALEGLLKATWLAQGNRAATSDALDKGFKRHGHNMQKWWGLAGMPAPSPDENVLLDFLTAYVETGRYPVRTRAQPQDGRLILPHGAREVIIGMLTAVDAKLEGLMPQSGPYIARPSLRSLGLRRTARRIKVPNSRRRRR